MAQMLDLWSNMLGHGTRRVTILHLRLSWLSWPFLNGKGFVVMGGGPSPLLIGAQEARSRRGGDGIAQRRGCIRGRRRTGSIVLISYYRIESTRSRWADPGFDLRHSNAQNQ